MYLLQVYLYWEIWICLLSFIWGNPVGLGPAYIILNEIGSNFGLDSYVELFANAGFSSEMLAALYFGILIIEPKTKKGAKNTIVAAFDLVELRQSPPDGKYFVLGNPPQSKIINPGQYFGTSVGRQPTVAHKMYERLDQWLQIDDTTIKMIILTCSRTKPITDSSLMKAPQSTRKKPALEDEDMMRDYVKDFQVDIAIIRGKRANFKDCHILDSLYSPRLKSYGRLLPYLPTVTEITKVAGQVVVDLDNDDKTLNKCGLDRLKANFHRAYKRGGMTPGGENKCEYPKFEIELFYENVRFDTQPSHTGLDGTCFLSNECLEGTCNPDQHNVFSKLTGEQLLSMVISEDTVDADTDDAPTDTDAILADAIEDENRSNEEDEDNDTEREDGCTVELNHDTLSEPPLICGDMNGLRQNIASLRNMIKVGDSKRRRVWKNPDTATCSNDPFDALKRKRERHVATAIIHIDNFQKDILDVNDVLKHSSWFQYNLNKDHPEESTYNCFYCNKYSEEYRIPTPNRLSMNEGRIEDSKEKNARVLQRHSTLSTHISVMQTYEEEIRSDMAKLISNDIAQNEPQRFVITNRHMRLVFKTCKRLNALWGHADDVLTAEKIGVDMGIRCKTTKAAIDMAKTISDQYQEEAKKLVLDSGSCSILLDGSSDISGTF